MSRGRRATASGAAPHDWSRYSLAQIWAMLEPQSRRSGVIAADAWSRMHTLCLQEADAIEGALSRLAERWPLTQAAAVAFQEWGAHLVKSMRGTAATAAQNHIVVDSITYEIDQARRQVAALQDEADEYQRIEAGSGRRAADVLFQSRYGGGSEVFGMLPPWQAGLSVVAQQMMAELEHVISLHHDLIAHDEPYELPSGSGVQPPPVAAGGTAGPDTQPTLSRSEWAYPSSDDYTTLDGVPSPQLSATAAAPTGAEPWVGASSGSFMDTPAGRVLAPGGVIVGPGPSRLFGLPGAAATRSTGAGPMPVIPPMMATSGASPARPSSSDRRARRGMRSVFEVPEGPPAVIRPPDEPLVHEPGPGVLGIDR